MSKNYHIAVLEGDGIGPEIMKQALKVLKVICKKFLIKINFHKYKIGGSAIDKYGTALPKETILGCESSDAILFGSIGGTKWNFLPIDKQPERAALLPLRKHFNLFINLRPAKIFPGLETLSPLKDNIVKNGLDIICVRELTGGIYFRKPKGRKYINNLLCAFDTELYYSYEIKRIAHIAFKLAMQRKKKVTSIDKANVLESSLIWRELVSKISQKYPEVFFENMHIDNASMQLIKKPSEFDILLCSNMFGDILSDECGALTGSIGMLPSASLNKNNFGLYEPAGGSAPDIANKNIANPIAQILSLSMLLKYSFNLSQISNIIEKSIINVLKKGLITQDLLNKNHTNFISTDEMGSEIAQCIMELKNE